MIYITLVRNNEIYHLLAVPFHPFALHNELGVRPRSLLPLLSEGPEIFGRTEQNSRRI